MDQNANLYAATMTPQQGAWFTAEYESVRKDEIIGALLAFFLGTLAHTTSTSIETSSASSTLSFSGPASPPSAASSSAS